MPYVSRELLRLALQTLKQGYSALLTVSLPCMLAKKIPTSTSAGQASKSAIRFGSAEEREWLGTYFKPGGGPPGLPYYMPGTGQWVQSRYPDRSAQRRRKDFSGSVFFHPTQHTWALRKGAADVLKDEVLSGKPPVPLVALMAWMWRARELPSLKGALDQFVAELGLSRDRLLETVYSPKIPEAFADAGLTDEPLTAEAVADLIGAAPPPPVLPEFSVAIARLEEGLKKRHVVLVPGLVGRIVGGWLVSDVVVLVGPTGSGKTFLATSLSRSLEELIGAERFLSVFVEVTRDYDVAQFLGYENLGGEFTTGTFTREALFVGEPTDPRLVVLDEWNLAQIDAYFAPVLSCLETRKPLTLPGRVNLQKLPDVEEVTRAQPEAGEGRCVLPEDTFFIATCNSWIDEPETRLPISGPVKRRCRIIQMPNVLELRFRDAGNQGLADVCDTILRQEQDAIERRTSSGRASIWDAHRAERLQAIPDFAALEEKTRQKLLQLARVLLEDAYTKNFFTVGLLRDVLLSCVYAEPGEEYPALGQQVADKILHQVQGETKLLETIVELCKEFPNGDGIRAQARVMGAFGQEKRIRPLV